MNQLSLSHPKVPMAPITSSDIPVGIERGYQIKWDSKRTLALK